MQWVEYSIVASSEIKAAQRDIDENLKVGAQVVHQIESYRILREGRAPILVTRPLWTSWVKDRSSRLTIGLDSADVNSLCNARHQLNCDVAVAVDL